jgi:GntR family transcriptional regulator
VHIAVDPKASLPPSEQIAQQVRFAIAAGELAPGERLPSVRGLAVDAVVNPTTVGKAWRDLEREGVIESRPGDGVFVAAAAPALCRASRDRVLRERLARLVGDLRSAGLGRAELEDWIDEFFAPKRRATRAGGQR